ncbi:DHA2 family efflux MFS transporter permease subunit [Fluviispira sanaruensis]|uniref:MFS transporter n=1 Tax=Fluviispira sanaruensis TaxID=2493639 RepID=A0A4P2VGK8_FLUSA|nr:DHA2 family efflux MFS transporter permease subunit [Fluviispira sanaruensis]BBH51751.1 MFS transporter [Fluviispira sanaruensis]
MTLNSRLIVFVAVLASLLEIIDTSIVNVAIPTIMGNLGATLEDASMIVTGYTVANAIVLPASAWLGERIGRRNYYLGCIIVFTTTSAACGLAPNLSSLIVFRILQGLAGGALLPTSQALIFEQFPKEKAGMAGAIFGMSVMIGPTLGPVLGGYLTDEYGWRSIFNINLPIGLLTLFVGMTCIQNRTDSESARKSNLDMYGLILLILGVGCLQFLLERGQADDWFSSKIITTCAIVSFIAIFLFIWWELKVKEPIINIKLFTNPIVLGGVLLMACLGFFLYGIVFVLPVFLNNIFHYTATQIGVLFIPGSLLTAILMPFVGKSVQKISDPRFLIVIGLICVELCLYSMTYFSPFTSQNELLGMLFIRGIAMAFLFIPINSSILSQFSGYELGQVAGLMNLFRQVGGSMGIALIDTLLSRNIDINYLNLISKISLLNVNVQDVYNSTANNLAVKFNSSIGMAENTNAALKNLYQRVQTQAFTLSFLQLVVIMMFIFSLSFIPLMLVKIKKKVKPVDSH